MKKIMSVTTAFLLAVALLVPSFAALFKVNAVSNTYTVTFDVTGADIQIPSQIIPQGELATRPPWQLALNAINGCRIWCEAAWYLNDELYDFGSPVTRSLPLHSILSSSCLGYAVPIFILISSEVRSPI